MRNSGSSNSFGNALRYLASIFIVSTLLSCGGGGGSPGVVSGGSGSGSTDTGSTVGSVSLLFSSSELKSAGTVGGEVTVTALVKSSTNTVLTAIPVTFSADSGALAVQDTATDQNGRATALLGTSGDHTNRTITVTAQAGGKTVTGTVDVVGTSITVVGPSTISAGGTGDFTITVKDSANAGVANVPVLFSSQKGNSIAVKTSNGGSASAPLTNSQGQVVLTLTATQSGDDVISVSGQGASNKLDVGVNSSTLTVRVFDSSNNEVSTASTSTSCQRVAARYEVGGVGQSGTINISTSRGNLYSNSTCAAALVSSSVSLLNGDSQDVYLKSETAGVATVIATVPSGPSAQTDVEFIAPLTASATLNLQVDPAVIGANSGTGQSEKATVTAVVRDGTTQNNFVKGAVVEFSLVTDQSGGALSNPSVVTTDESGSASVVFTAGTAVTSTDGVTIQAKIQGTSTTATATLTVAKKSLFISAGTGNTLATPSTSTYRQDYTVFVTDAGGNPVSGATVTATIIPTRYKKGSWSVQDHDNDPSTSNVWAQNVVGTCPNEDDNNDGILDAGEDDNNSTHLDPGISGVNISSTGTTDASGTATVSVLYARDRANWLEVQMTIRGEVAGTESVYQPPAYVLPILADDTSDLTVAPPGQTSPFGVNPCNQAN